MSPTVGVLLSSQDESAEALLGEKAEQAKLSLRFFYELSDLLKAVQTEALAAVLIDCHYCNEETREAFFATEPRPTIVAIVTDESALMAAEQGADHLLPLGAQPGLTVATLKTAVNSYWVRLDVIARARALEHTSDMVELASADARLEYVNPEFLKVNGYTLEEVLGKTPAQLLRSDEHDEEFYEVIWETVSSGQIWSGAFVSARKDGSKFYEVATISPISDRSGKVVKYVAIKHPVPGISDAPLVGAFDVQQSRSIRVALSGLVASEMQFRTMIETAGDAIMVVDFNTARYIDMNSAACDLFGYSRDEFRELVARQVVAPEAEKEVDAISEKLRSDGRATVQRLRMVRKDGSLFWAAISFTSYTVADRRMYCSIVRDVSELVEREQELDRTNQELAQAQGRLLQSARLAALGQLAAGVAHEVNNPLQFMQTSLEDLRHAVGEVSNAAQALADLSQGVERIGSVVGELLPFARVELNETSEVDVNEVINASAKMLSNQVKLRARLKLSFGDLPRLVGYREKLGQVMTNLILNAAHSVEEGAAESNQIVISSTLEGDYIVIRVRDTGSGIEPEVLAQLFEPFFTTRSPNWGTGLGLAVTKDIARIHGGAIEVTTKLGVGSVFTLTLPIHNGLQLTRTSSVRPAPRRNTRILLIDDEPLILKSYQRVLKKDFEISTALGGQAALDLLAKDQDFDVIVCDLMMPTVDGVLIYEYLEDRAFHLLPGLIFCTGGIFSERVRQFIEMSNNRLLYKPISPKALRETVAQVASENQASPLSL